MEKITEFIFYKCFLKKLKNYIYIYYKLKYIYIEISNYLYIVYFMNIL